MSRYILNSKVITVSGFFPVKVLGEIRWYCSITWNLTTDVLLGQLKIPSPKLLSLPYNQSRIHHSDYCIKH